ncbi:MAG: MerC domain-containing protein [Pseudomonadota bacterium]|nr:MerC domain-containing protein [Pseudomonadota bacterium]
MKTLQPTSDLFAIGLSMACAVHCLLLPFLLVFMPSALAMVLDNEAFHTWMLIAVIPLSFFALTLGCRQHKRYQLLALCSVGLLLMVSAVLWGESWFGELGEKFLTLAGALFVALGHWLNHRLCRQKKLQQNPVHDEPSRCCSGSDCHS